jgi:hypothetical protein
LTILCRDRCERILHESVVRTKRVQAENHASMAVRTRRDLGAKEPFWLNAGNFVLDHKPSAGISGVELLKAWVKSAINLAGVHESALRQGVIDA